MSEENNLDDPAGYGVMWTRTESGLNAQGLWVGLSKREYAAIHLCVPMSGNEELDKMINAARMDRFAMVALANYQGAKRAFEIADEMLAASKGEK